MTRTTLIALVALTTVLTSATSWAKGPTYAFQSRRKPGDVDRVAALLELGGDRKDLVDGKVQRAKLSLTAKLRYDEKALEVPRVPDGGTRTVRYYDEVSAVIKVEDEGVKPELRDDRHLVVTEARGRTLTMFSPRGTLTRGELDLIDVLGNTVLLDRLLPPKAVAVGDSWKLSEDLLICLLRLDDAAKVDVQCKLSEVTSSAARFEMTGRVEGATEGVSTRIELKAKYRFNRRTGRIDWLGLLVKEDRDIGHVAAGIDGVARLQVQVSPTADSARLDDAALEGVPFKANSQLTRLVHTTSDAPWRFTYDRRWHVTTDRSDLAVLRMLDRGEFLAQCNVSPLPQRQPDKQITLARFQQDVQQALGESFGEFVRASQFANDSDYRVYRLVVRGKVDELPIQWIYYLVADRHGHQVVFAFTVEQELVERLGKADEALVGGLRFDVPKDDP